MRAPCIATVVGCLSLVGAGAASAALPARVAPEKFIPSFAICYSDAQGARPTEETARFDLLVVCFSQHAASVWGREGKNSWQSLKALNPDLVIALTPWAPVSTTPPTGARSARGGVAEAPPWQGHRRPLIALGQRSGGYLQSAVSPRAPDGAGQPQLAPLLVRYPYQVTGAAARAWTAVAPDAIFSDNTSFMILADQWRVEGRPEEGRPPATMPTGSGGTTAGGRTSSSS